MSRLAFCFCIAALAATPALSQQPSSLGIGAQVGDPTGLTMRIGTAPMAVDIAAGWNLGRNQFFGQAHLVMANPSIAPALPLHLFYGPGAFIGAGDESAELGVSFNAGLSYYTGPLEFFGQLTPRLRLVDSTGFNLGGGIGLRYYL